MPRSNECEDGQTVFLSSSDCLAAPLRHNISLWLRFRCRGHCVVSILRFNDGWAMPTASIHEVDVTSDGEWIPSDCHEMDRPNRPVTQAKLIPLRSQIFKSHLKESQPSGTTRTWCEMGEISASLCCCIPLARD